MPETISPVTREEDYLAAIAGQDVTPPTPVTRKEEWLDLIADKVDDLAGDLSTAEGEIDDLQDIVPTPAADDSGKVLTAGADGTASWQTASGGGGDVAVFRFTIGSALDASYYGLDLSPNLSDVIAAWKAGKVVMFVEGYYDDNEWYPGNNAPITLQSASAQEPISDSSLVAYENHVSYSGSQINYQELHYDFYNDEQYLWFYGSGTASLPVNP